MTHLHILAETEIEAINGGRFDFAGNYAFLPQSNTAVSVPVALGGFAGVIGTQGNLGFILQTALA